MHWIGRQRRKETAQEEAVSIRTWIMQACSGLQAVCLRHIAVCLSSAARSISRGPGRRVLGQQSLSLAHRSSDKRRPSMRSEDLAVNVSCGWLAIHHQIRWQVHGTDKLADAAKNCSACEALFTSQLDGLWQRHETSQTARCGFVAYCRTADRTDVHLRNCKLLCPSNI
jgi:hypothetical protein